MSQFLVVFFLGPLLFVTSSGIQAGSPSVSPTPDLAAARATLATSRVFRLGPIGMAAKVSDEEKALRSILASDSATDELLAVLQRATPEGRLYALFGLRRANASMFSRTVELYRHPLQGDELVDGEVAFQVGDVPMPMPYEQAIVSIENDQFDILFDGQVSDESAVIEIDPNESGKVIVVLKRQP